MFRCHKRQEGCFFACLFLYNTSAQHLTPESSSQKAGTPTPQRQSCIHPGHIGLPILMPTAPVILLATDETGSYKPPTNTTTTTPKGKKAFEKLSNKTHSKNQTEVRCTQFPGLGNRRPSSQHWLLSDHPVHRKLTCKRQDHTH